MNKYFIYSFILSVVWYILYLNADSEIEQYAKLIISQIFTAAMGIILAIESKSK